MVLPDGVDRAWRSVGDFRLCGFLLDEGVPPLRYLPAIVAAARDQECSLPMALPYVAGPQQTGLEMEAYPPLIAPAVCRDFGLDIFLADERIVLRDRIGQVAFFVIVVDPQNLAQDRR